MLHLWKRLCSAVNIFLREGGEIVLLFDLPMGNSAVFCFTLFQLAQSTRSATEGQIFGCHVGLIFAGFFCSKLKFYLPELNDTALEPKTKQI